MNQEEAAAKMTLVSEMRERRGLSRRDQSPVGPEKKAIDKKQNEGRGVNPPLRPALFSTFSVHTFPGVKNEPRQG